MSEQRGKRLPVIIGVARLTEKGFMGTPSVMFSQVLQRGMDDAVVGAQASAKHKLAQSLTDVATVRTATEDSFKKGTNCEPYTNLAQQIAKMAGASNENTKFFATSSGGNTPQLLVNVFAEKIAKGESECVAIVGGELLESFTQQTRKQQALPNWGAKYEETLVTKPVDGILGKYGDKDIGVHPVERANRVVRPSQMSAMYALLEQAYRAERGDTIQANIERNSLVFDRFNEVAATKQSELAWFSKRRTAREIATEAPSNRWVTYPYPKYLNAVMQVNQAACVIMVSEEFADKLGVPRDRRVYLRGCADAVEPGYFVCLRPRLGTSYAMTECIDSAMRHAKVSAKDLTHFDLYSCFPVAVNVAADFMHYDPTTDPRAPTVTGGLPYYGGPGNSYVACSIAVMVETLRSRPKGEFGLLNGNGWFLTKHSCGIYSREPPPEGVFVREDPSLCQARANKRAGPLVEVSASPSGNASIETYTVDFPGKDKPPRVVAYGRLVDGPDAGKRFVGVLHDSEDVLQWMKKDGIGMRVVVSTEKDGKSFFKTREPSDWAKQKDSGVPISAAVLTGTSKM